MNARLVPSIRGTMPYRDAYKPLPTCSACSAKVPPSELLFSDDGSLVCARCRAIEDARKQIRRAYDEALRDEALEREYAELAEATAPPPPLVRGLIPCASCQRSVHASELARNDRNEPVCRQCRWKTKKERPES